MSATSSIEWTDATWNPTRGCSVVSPGCTKCYAMKFAHRFSGVGGRYEGLTKLTKGGPVWTGKVRLVPELLDWPLRKRKPLRIFVNSMSDLFHEDVPDEFIAEVFSRMALATQHTFQILTKRPERMMRWCQREALWWGNKARIERRSDYGRPLPNVHLGVSVEDHARADQRIPLLLQTPAAVRWISAEPLLGDVDFTRWLYPEIYSRRDDVQTPALDWVVVGGESGPGARECKVEWIRSILDQCRAAGVPTFCKQMGARLVLGNNDDAGWAEAGKWTPQIDATMPGPSGDILHARDRLIWHGCDRKGGDPTEWPPDLRVREFPL